MITIVFLVVLVFGLIVAAFALLSLSRSFSPGSQAQTDATARVLRLIPLSIGIGATVFGGVGLLLTQLTGMETGLSVIWALGAGLLVGFITQAILYYRAMRQTAPPSPLPDEALGRTAEVVIAIPGNGIGQIVYRGTGDDIHVGASSATFQTIPAGETVTIERIIRRVALVRPIQPIQQ